jgi:hypothetical protein
MAHIVSPVGATKRLGLLQLVVLAAPLVWIVVAFLHPNAEPYEGIADEANRWIFVHVIQLVLTPFLAAGVWLLMEGIHSVAASVTRAVLAFWMVFFSAFDAVAGIATGVLTRHANSLAGSEKEGVVAAINFLWDDSRLAGGGFSFLGILGQGSWIVLAIAATVAVYRAGLRRLLVGATLGSVLFAGHAGPIAAVGLVAFFGALLLRFRAPGALASPSGAHEAA